MVTVKEKEKRKYLETILLDKKFFKKLDLNLSEKEKQYTKSYKILEYTKQDIENFLDFFISLKESSDTKLVTYDFSILEEKQLKSLNHHLYRDLFDTKLGKNIETFLLKLSQKIDEENNNCSTLMKVDEYNLFDTYLNAKKIHLRNIIRIQKILNKGYEKKFVKTSYEDKIKILVAELREIKNNSNEIEYREVVLDVCIQLITYDILHEKIELNKREENYKKLDKFISELSKEISSEINKISLEKAEIKRKDIYLDFYNYIVLINDLIKEKGRNEIALKLIPLTYDFEPINKKEQFLSLANGILETSINLGDLYMPVVNFFDVPEVREALNEDTFFLHSAVVKKIVEKEKKITKTREAELIYGNPKIKNNFDKTEAALDEILKNYSFYTEKNLQIKKALVRSIENDKRLISPFRRQLKSLIGDSKLSKSSIVETECRLRITQGMYKEKEIEEEFYKSHEIQNKINDLMLEIYKEKDFEDREKLFEIFKDKFFNFFIEIMRDEIVFAFKIPEVPNILA